MFNNKRQDLLRKKIGAFSGVSFFFVGALVDFRFVEVVREVIGIEEALAAAVAVMVCIGVVLVLEQKIVTAIAATKNFACNSAGP